MPLMMFSFWREDTAHIPLRRLFLTLLAIKLMLACLVFTYGGWRLGLGNDAEYYHAYAMGTVEHVSSFWPVWLRALNGWGLYSRLAVTAVMMILVGIAIPLMTGYLVTRNRVPGRQSGFWCIAVLVGLYPVLLYYAQDIYRDALMCCLLLMGVYAVQAVQEAPGLRRLSYLIGVMILGVLLYLLRPYLGAAFGAAFIAASIYRFQRWPLLWTVLAYLLVLESGFAIGLFDSLLSYREGFGRVILGGSNLNIRYIHGAAFVPVFLQNAAVQMFGLYFGNVWASGLFIVESLPFVIALVYIIKNRRYAPRSVDFLVLFFMFYGTVWLIGNDNFGTAVRLRIPNYLVVLIIAGKIFFEKNDASVMRHGSECK